MVANHENYDVDGAIEAGLRGKGALAEPLFEMRGRLIESGRKQVRMENADLPPAELAKLEAKQEAQIVSTAKEKLRKYAKGEFKERLEKSLDGEPMSVNEQEKMKQMMGMVGAAGQVSSAMSGGGGMFGMFTALREVMNVAGEYIVAGFRYFFGKKDDPNAPKSYGEAVAQVKAEKTMPEFGKAFGVDSKQLMAELSQPKAAAPNTSPATIASAQAIELDVDLNTAKITDASAKQKVDTLRKEGKINGNFATKEAVAVLDGVKANIPGVKGTSIAKDESASL